MCVYYTFMMILKCLRGNRQSYYIMTSEDVKEMTSKMGSCYQNKAEKYTTAIFPWSELGIFLLVIHLVEEVVE